MLVKEFSDHKVAYGFLLFGLVVCVSLFLAAWPSRVLQRMIALVTTAFYILWGIISHLRSRNISKQILYEYIAIGSLGGLILLFLTI